MSIKYLCIKEQKLVISVWHRAVTFDQWMGNLKALLSDPGFSFTNKQLVDIHIGSADVSIGDEEIVQAMKFISRHPELIAGRKVAIVAGNEFRRSSLFSQLARAQSLNTIVFNDLHTACKWLGIDGAETAVTIEQIRNELNFIP